MDYLGYWGLKRRPFFQGSISANESPLFFAAAAQREAIAGLDYFVASTWNSAFLVAPPRSGMTWLMTRLAAARGFGDCAAEVVLTAGNGTATDVLNQFATGIGIRSSDEVTPEDLCRCIDASSRKGIRTVWMIDDCAAAAATVARDLVMGDGDLSVVMGCDADRVAKLTSVFGRCCMRIELEPIDVADSLRFIADALTHAGGKATMFTDAAVVRLHEMAEGRIASIADLAETTLQVAAGHRIDPITPSVVEAAVESIEQHRHAA